MWLKTQGSMLNYSDLKTSNALKYMRIMNDDLLPRKSIYLLWLMGALLLQNCSSDSKQDKLKKTAAIGNAETLVDDGAWCWFSDPRAIYYKGQKEQIFYAYINSRGDVCIGSKDLASSKVESFVLHDTLEIDDHNVPSILVLPGGQLMAFYNEHNGNVFMRKSENPEDISSWHEERIIARETEGYNYTYTNPLRLEKSML